MGYYKIQDALYYINTTSGDVAIYHKNGKFWSYKKFDREEARDMMMEAEKAGTEYYFPRQCAIHFLEPR